LSIRMDAGSSGFVSGLKSLFSVARTGSSGRTVTTGVRGLDKDFLGGGLRVLDVLFVQVARTGSSGRTVTTGVRGRDKEDNKNAKPNPEEVKKLAAFAASRGDAEKFAAGNPQLKTQKIDYLQAAK